MAAAIERLVARQLDRLNFLVASATREDADPGRPPKEEHGICLGRATFHPGRAYGHPGDGYVAPGDSGLQPR
jgi:hypothetical protein